MHGGGGGNIGPSKMGEGLGTCGAKEKNHLVFKISVLHVFVDDVFYFRNYTATNYPRSFFESCHSSI